MPRTKRDPLYWPKIAAQHPVMNTFGHPNQTPHGYLCAVSRTGEALYYAKFGCNKQTWWLRRPGEQWMIWTTFYDPGMGKKNRPNPPSEGRWHHLTAAESYAAQRLRIDPNWEPDVE